MEKRIGWSATTVSISAGIVLAIYEVMEWKMPDIVANVLIAITSLAGFIAVTVLCHSVWVWSRPIRKRYALQLPVYGRDKPNPMQWLLDTAKEQRDLPCNHLVFTDCVWFDFSRDDKRPRLRIQISYKNLGIYDLSVGQPYGYVSYKSEQLPDHIIETEAHTTVPSGGIIPFHLDVYIPKEFHADICAEMDSAMGEIRGIDLQGLKVKVHAKADDAPSVLLSLWAAKMVIRPNR